MARLCENELIWFILGCLFPLIDLIIDCYYKSNKMATWGKVAAVWGPYRIGKCRPLRLSNAFWTWLFWTVLFSTPFGPAVRLDYALLAPSDSIKSSSKFRVEIHVVLDYHRPIISLSILFVKFVVAWGGLFKLLFKPLFAVYVSEISM